MRDIEFLHPDLLLLDYTWNNHTHEDLLLQQLKLYPAIASLPVILSATDEQVLCNRSAVLQAQGIFVLLKPFEIDDLLHLVQQALYKEHAREHEQDTEIKRLAATVHQETLHIA